MTEIKDLNTRIRFYEFRPKEGPLPGEKEAHTLYECWAEVENVWMRDIELAKSTGTLEDLTIKIRDPRGHFMPQKKNYVGIVDAPYEEQRYNIKAIRPDLKDKRFVTIIASVQS